MAHKPVVLCFSGHDPSGGAGIQADIETLTSHGCHAASIITCLTEQDSRNVRRIWPQPIEPLLSQARTLLNDLQVDVIKIGLLGDDAIAHAIAELLRQRPQVPVVLDPVLAAGGGTPMSNQALRTTLMTQLLPLTTLLTPNSEEARALSGEQNLIACGQALLAAGAQHVLITGAHESSLTVDNTLFLSAAEHEVFHWQRLPHHYHGSGCTLASACAALLAQGLDVLTAVNEAQDFTWHALAAAYRPGQGQHNPDRLFWSET